ncbi:hypothetical protein J1614_011644 [Plenodomus biglobosus]|nr:hypothetical protein J1614_011644 [Plenodomus biglobosus]
MISAAPIFKFWVLHAPLAYGYVVATSAKDGTNAANSSCVSLSHVLYGGDEQYRNRTESYWSVSAQLTPDCIVQPLSTEDVSNIVKTLVRDGPCGKTNFAVRGGGHTTWAGSNNIDSGVTIDLGLMNTTTWNSETEIASIDPGSRWNAVYSTLDPLGVTVVGGRAGTVGVAGFLMGGGNSFFTARKGFACDTVTNFEVTSEVINANADENSDLHRALKGGSANFGIVTRFDVQGFTAGDLWGGIMMYPKSVTQQQIEAYHAWTENVENYQDGSSILFWTYLPTAKDILILTAFEDTAGNEAPAGFDKFMAIPNSTSSTMRMASHKELTDELEQPGGYR